MQGGAAVVRKFGEKGSASDGMRRPTSLLHQVEAELISEIKAKDMGSTLWIGLPQLPCWGCL